MVRFLAFEGIDGSGKSTLINQLAAELKVLGIPYVLTREPGGTPLAEEIRNLLLRVDKDSPVDRAELLLYQAGRAQHVEKVIKPALASGKWVLCDRFAASTLAFQCFARGLDISEAKSIIDFAVQGCKPDLNILLDLAVEEGQRRLQERNQKSGEQNDRFEREKKDFHNKVRQGYLQLAAMEDNWLTIDAGQNHEEVYLQLHNYLKGNQWLVS